MKNLWRWLTTLLSRRPHTIIGGADDPYMLRWYLIPRNRWMNVYLHKFLRSDDDRALHCHPWASLSIILWGEYCEVQAGGALRFYSAGSVIFRRPTFRHRIITFGDPVWTLFITGPKVRTWGFWTPSGWVDWKTYLKQEQDDGKNN